jgi:hypothetical protein
MKQMKTLYLAILSHVRVIKSWRLQGKETILVEKSQRMQPFSRSRKTEQKYKTPIYGNMLC